MDKHYENNLYFVFSQQKTGNRQLRSPFSSSIRLLFALWLLVSLLIADLYSGKFCSQLSIPEYEKSIDRIDDLQRILTKNQHMILNFPFLDGFIRTASPNDSIYYTLKKYVKRFESILFI